MVVVAVLCLLVIAVIGAALFSVRDGALRLITPGGGAATLTSVRYGDGVRGTLDLYVPRNTAGAPVVVFFYGGSWQMGDKEMYGFVGKALAKRGILAIIPDYRLYPEAGFPAFLQDGAAAMRWVRDHAREHGGDPSNLFVMGHSAGAHIAAMLALDPQWLGAQGMKPSTDIAGLIGISGPYDFLPLKSDKLIAVFGGNDRPETQPINFVTRNAPPALLLTGDKDEVVQPRNTERLAEKLRQKGVAAREIVYPGRGHIGTILPLIGPLGFLAPVLDDVTGFVAGAKR